MIQPRMLPNGNLIVPVGRKVGKDRWAEVLQELGPTSVLYREWLPVIQKQKGPRRG